MTGVTFPKFINLPPWPLNITFSREKTQLEKKNLFAEMCKSQPCFFNVFQILFNIGYDRLG